VPSGPSRARCNQAGHRRRLLEHGGAAVLLVGRDIVAGAVMVAAAAITSVTRLGACAARALSGLCRLARREAAVGLLWEAGVTTSLAPGWLTRLKGVGFAVCGLHHSIGPSILSADGIALSCLPCLHEGTLMHVPQWLLVLLPCEGWVALPARLECTHLLNMETSNYFRV
jgi:hypothetical protein